MNPSRFTAVVADLLFVPVCGVQKLQTGPDAIIEFEREHPVIALYLKRDSIAQPPWNAQHVTMRANSHLSLALVNDSGRPVEILGAECGLHCVCCVLHNERGPVAWHIPNETLPPRVPKEVFSLSAGSKVVHQDILLPWYELSWLEPGNYMLQIIIREGSSATDPFTRRSAKLTPLALEKWVNLELIR